MAALIPIGPMPFALNPAQAVPGPINFATKEGRSYYKDGVEPLDVDDKFDVQPEGLKRFRELLSNRAAEFNWNGVGGILQVPPDPANPIVGTPIDLIDHYGERTLEQLDQWERTYIGTPSRRAQDTYMLYKCLWNSISPEGRDKISIWKNEYHVLGQPAGVLLYKIIVREAHIDTNATATSIRTQMSELDEYMVQIGSDITAFNQHVKALIDGLAARGQTSNDLLVNLFKAYKAAGDDEFVRYINDKESRYDENDLTLTVPSLMNLADTKYKILNEKKLWKAKTPEQENIVALQGEVSQLKKTVKFAKDAITKKKTPTKHKTQKQTPGKKQKPNWLLKNERPADADLHKERTWNGNPYHFCCKETGGKCNGVWRVHKPAECRGTAKDNKEKKSKKDEKRKLKLQKAMEARLQDSDDDMRSVSDDE